MAQHRAIARGEHGGEVARVAAEGGVAHGVNPAIKGMKPARPDPPRDRVPVKPELVKLADANDAVLRPRESGDPLIAVWGC
jgi:hypothetical protein